MFNLIDPANMVYGDQSSRYQVPTGKQLVVVSLGSKFHTDDTRSQHVELQEFDVATGGTKTVRAFGRPFWQPTGGDPGNTDPDRGGESIVHLAGVSGAGVPFAAGQYVAIESVDGSVGSAHPAADDGFWLGYLRDTVADDAAGAILQILEGTDYQVPTGRTFVACTLGALDHQPGATELSLQFLSGATRGGQSVKAFGRPFWRRNGTNSPDRGGESVVQLMGPAGVGIAVAEDLYCSVRNSVSGHSSLDDGYVLGYLA